MEEKSAIEFIQTIQPSSDLDDGDVIRAVEENIKSKTSINQLLWNKAEYTPMYVEKEKFVKTGLNFTILTYPSINALTPGVHKSIIEYIKYLTAMNFRYRHTLVGEHDINTELVKEANGLVTVYSNLKFLVPSDFSNSAVHSEESMSICAGIHGKFDKLPPSVRFGYSCVIQSLLGSDLNNPADFLLIYTVCGTTDYDYEDSNQRATFGFIGNFVKFAKVDCGIPVFNIKAPNCKEQLKEFVNIAIEKQKQLQMQAVNDF